MDGFSSVRVISLAIQGTQHVSSRVLYTYVGVLSPLLLLCFVVSVLNSNFMVVAKLLVGTLCSVSACSSHGRLVCMQDWTSTQAFADIYHSFDVPQLLHTSGWQLGSNPVCAGYRHALRQANPVCMYECMGSCFGYLLIRTKGVTLTKHSILCSVSSQSVFPQFNCFLLVCTAGIHQAVT